MRKRQAHGRWLLGAGILLGSCGSPPAASTAKPTSTDTPPSSLVDARRTWVEIYRRAGFISSGGQEWVEIWFPAQQSSLYGWHAAGGLTPVEPGVTWLDCHAFDLAPAALRPRSGRDELAEACHAIEPQAVSGNFAADLLQILDEYERNAPCLPEDATSDDPTAAWDWPTLSTLLLHQPEDPSPLDWVAYASWADELGLHALEGRALAAAEKGLAHACIRPPCTARQLIESASQRALIGEALIGLTVNWLDRPSALALARRALQIAPNSPHAIAAQARALTEQLQRDLDRDAGRSRAGSRPTGDLDSPATVSTLLARLPDTVGTVFGAPDRGCFSPDPAVELADRSLEAVPGLLDLLGDRRLTRAASGGMGDRPLPLLRVGEVALATIEEIALTTFGDGDQAQSAARTWWENAQGKSEADLAATALRSAPPRERLRMAQALGERDLHRLVLELPAAIRAAQDVSLRAALVGQFAAPRLAELAARDRCANTSAAPRFPTPSRLLAPEVLVWQRMAQRVKRSVQLPPDVRRVVFRTLLLTISDPEPGVRLAAARALLSWGRKEGLARVMRDAAVLAREGTSGREGDTRDTDTIEYLVASGTSEGLATALPLVTSSRSETLEAAALGLSSARLQARAARRNFSLPEAMGDMLAERAAATLSESLETNGIDFALGGVLSTSGMWLLELVRTGPDYEPRPYPTPALRLERALALVNAERARHAQPPLPSPFARPPEDPRARQWVEKWRARTLDPEQLLQSFFDLATGAPEREWRLRLVRSGASTSVHLDASESANEDTRLTVLCHASGACPWLLHDHLSQAALRRRLQSLRSSLAQLWRESPAGPLDISLKLSVRRPADNTQSSCRALISR